MGSDLTPPPYQRWINNPPGWGVGEPLSSGPFGLDSNGAWMESGDYERAFRGFPSPKTINIFAGGFAQAPSTKSIIFGGLANFGVKALGLWFLSKLARPAQTATTVQQKFPFSDYFSNLNLKFNWGSTGTTGGGTTGTTSTRSTETDPDKGKKDKVDNNDNDNDTVDDPNKDKKSGDVNGKQKDDIVTTGDNVSTVADNTISTNVYNIKGKVVNVVQGSEAETKGYPKKFTIEDSSTTGNDNKNTYTYYYGGFDEQKGKPIYVNLDAEVHLKDETNKNGNITVLYADTALFEDKDNDKIIDNMKTSGSDTNPALISINKVQASAIQNADARMQKNVGKDEQATKLTLNEQKGQSKEYYEAVKKAQEIYNKIP